MACCPVTPAEVQAIIPTSTATLCERIQKTLVQQPDLFYQVMNWLFTSDACNFNADVLKLMQDPAGVVKMWGAAASVPTGYLLCDGSAVSRSTYADLFTAISTTWGVGDGATTFNVPDFRDFFPIGASAGKAPATTGGSTTATLNSTHMPPHTHVTSLGRAIADGNAASNSGGLLGVAATTPMHDVTSASTGGTAGVAQPLTVLNPYKAIRFVIKT